MAALVQEVTLETVNARLSTTPRGTAGGCDARFTPITNKWGFKMYVNLIEAYYTYFRQRILHHHGLSPAVGQQMPAIEIPFGDDCGETRQSWGYVVQMVRIGQDYQPNGWCFDDLWEAADNLNERLEELTGTPDGDLHPKNVGFDDNDNLLIVDCGQGTRGHDEVSLENLRSDLIALDLWRGDDVEYGLWGRDFDDSRGLLNWDKCDCVLCIEKRKQDDDDFWSGELISSQNSSCQCSFCHSSKHKES